MIKLIFIFYYWLLIIPFLNHVADDINPVNRAWVDGIYIKIQVYYVKKQLYQDIIHVNRGRVDGIHLRIQVYYVKIPVNRGSVDVYYERLRVNYWEKEGKYVLIQAYYTMLIVYFEIGKVNKTIIDIANDLIMNLFKLLFFS